MKKKKKAEPIPFNNTIKSIRTNQSDQMSTIEVPLRGIWPKKTKGRRRIVSPELVQLLFLSFLISLL